MSPRADQHIKGGLMSEPWTQAVNRGLEDDTIAADALKTELGYLWSDLADARHYAINNTWSMQCDWLTERIVWLTRLTGQATPWEEVPADLLLNGVYQGILRSAGIEFPEPDLTKARETAKGPSSRPAP